MILFSSVHCTVKGLLQNKLFGMNDKETNRLLSSTLGGATLFPDHRYRR